MHSKVAIIARWILLLALSMGCPPLAAQIRDSNRTVLPAQTLSTNSPPKLNKRIGLGVFDHQEGRLFHGAFEFLLVKRLSLEPSIGFTCISTKDFPITPRQNVLQFKYAGGIDAKIYLLWNKRHPLEGFFTTLHFGYYRSSVHPTISDYVAYRGFQVERGAGFGGQYFIYKRFGIGGNAMLNYVLARDFFLKPDGSIRYLHSRPGFIITYCFQLGFTF